MKSEFNTDTTEAYLEKPALIELFSNYLKDIESGKPFNAALHPNGYIKCVLETHDNGSRTRLHMWDSAVGGYRDPAIHNHCWDFSSQILLGTIKEEVYEFGAGKSDEQTWDAYEFYRDQEKRGLRGLGKSKLRLAKTVTHEAGSVYSRHHDTLHLVTAEGDFTATFVHEGPTVRTTNQVFMQQDVQPLTTIKLEYKPTPPDILIITLRRLLDGLKTR